MDAAKIAACTDAAMGEALRFESPLTAAMERFAIESPRQQAAFLATVSVESMRLTKVEEGLYYKDPVRLAKIYPRAFKSAADAEPYARNPKALGDLLYKGYWGRGLIQLTWRDNYAKASNALGFDYLAEPNLVLEPLHAALTAGWFWSANGCNEPADRGDMKAVTRIVNGPALMHLSERQAQYDTAMEVLA